MTKKMETLKLVASLEQTGRKTKKAIWKDLAQRISAPTRQKIDVNVDKINEMAKKCEGKILIVPGKILSSGELTKKVKVVAVDASDKAIEKISLVGEFIYLKDFVSEKVKTNELVIVK